MLLLVGLVNVERIPTFKRTQDFAIDDFYLLENLTSWFGAPIVSTPHVLSQISDLTDLSGSEHKTIRTLLKTTIANIEEQYDPAVELVDDPMFERFGLADTSIAAVAKRNMLIVTADLMLHTELAVLGRDALNLNHVRALSRNSDLMPSG